MSRAPLDPMLESNVESALAACGRDRVFHNDGKPPSVAIRWTPTQIPPDEKWIVESGTTHSEAGVRAAREFASRLRAQAKALNAWADSITKPLEKGQPT